MEELQANWNSSLERKTREFQQAEEAQMHDCLAKLKNEITVTTAEQEVFEEIEKPSQIEATQAVVDQPKRKLSQNNDSNTKKPLFLGD